MADLPKVFLASMKDILGKDYEAFLAASGGGRQYGLRINTLKTEREEFERIAPFHLKKIPWIPNGYFYEAQDAPAGHPFYAAGLYYLQEPSAMTPASRLPVYPGEKVLDLCAAPGGKATELGAALKGEGLLVANDINNARAKALLRNLELFGIKNSFVTNEPPHVLAEHFPEYFDKIMVDAPCSGEGMFRKNPAVMEAWEEKGPEYFSKIQREIIVNAADMLRSGGMMFYSTCTFSPLENEKTITHLLRERPEMEVVPMDDYEGFTEGLLSYRGEDFHESCRICRRIWPHKMEGEGHFLALLHKRTEEISGNTDSFIQKKRKKNRRNLRKNGEAASPDTGWWGKVPAFNKEQKTALADFFSHVNRAFDPRRIDVRGDKVYYLPETDFDGRGLHFFRNGLFMGELKKKRFEPSQPFALSLAGEEFDACLDFAQDDERLNRYLRGETLDVSDLEGNRKTGGWRLLLAAGHPVGFGKLVNGTLKNKYPAGWRKN